MGPYPCVHHHHPQRHSEPEERLLNVVRLDRKMPARDINTQFHVFLPVDTRGLQIMECLDRLCGGVTPYLDCRILYTDAVLSIMGDLMV